MKREEEKKEMHDKDSNSIKTEPTIYNSKLHCKELFKEIFKNHVSDGLDNFEDLSYYIKKKNFAKKFQYTKKENQPKNVIDLTKYEKNNISNKNKKIKKKELEMVNSYMEDLPNQFRILEWAGVGFNNVETYKLNLSLKKLLAETQAVWIRFFGKIYGRKSDYYIVYGSLPTYSIIIKGNNEKAGKEGLNKYTFWVANSALEEWTELPEISSEQLKASRLFKYYFTGDLYADVSSSFNYFPGYEIQLLKCQVLRIMHGSFIVPGGYLKIKGEVEEGMEGKLVENDNDFVMPSMEELNSLERWSHEYANILLSGRIIHLKAETEEAMNELLEKDKYIERLLPIQTDEPFGESRPSWFSRIIGDPQQYSQLPPKDGMINYACLVIRSLRWPGTIAAFKGGEFVCMYLGDGIKYGGTVFFPTQPTAINNDPEGGYEHYEPYPNVEPELIEEDTDKEDEGEGGEMQ